MGLELWAAVVGLALSLPAVFVYNRLVSERNQARQGYADIDVQLKRRADLVPQPAAARFGAERSLGEGLHRLVLLAEAYPQLKADASFRDLSARLVEVEDQLQFARRFYNGAVQQYLTRMESVPDVLIAKLFRFEPMPFFETDDREAVGVKV
ncbi:MAG TPA: LemA family protein [Burkholderiales bacterium]